MVGKMIGGRYEVLEKIGGGGTSIVYKAHCHMLNRNVAIKMLRKELMNNDEFVRHFSIEAQAAAKLTHPNIVQIYDIGSEDGVNYIVMELVEGITLKELITQKGALPVELALKFSEQIASALKLAHQNHIVHRDVKSHNMLITHEGNLKVADFGIARMVSDETVRLGIDNIASVHYMSPEQARGKVTDEKSDLYSLGVVMYEMLTGRVPFVGDTPVAVAIKQVQEEPVPISALRPEVPERVEQIVKRAMQKSTSDRYPSADAMLKDIQLVRGGGAPLSEGDLGATQKTTIVPPVSGSGRGMTEQAKPKEGGAREPVKDEGGKKKEDKVAVLAAVATVMVVVVVSLALMFGGFGDRNAEKIRVPDLVGKTVDEAYALLEENNMKDLVTIVEDGTEPNDEYEAGVIIDQDKDPDKKQKTPLKIKVILSEGRGSISVPDVVDLEIRDAQIKLEKEGILYTIEEIFDESVPVDVVVRTSPQAKGKISEGDRVKLYVSKGPEEKMVRMPYLIGEEYSDAKQILTDNDLTLGETKYEESEEEEGTVIAQSVKRNTEIPSKTEIHLTVSSGKGESISSPSNSTDSEPQKTTKTFTLNLPQDRETVHVKVVVDGSVIYDEIKNTADGSATVRVTGSGTKKASVYFDDQFVHEETIQF